MAFQQTLNIPTRGRGTEEITDAVAEIVTQSGITCGLANVFVQHTSCSVILTENADPSVRHDLEMLARRWAPDGDSAYRHADEGDEPAQAGRLGALGVEAIDVPHGEDRRDGAGER